jgi:DamX protein
VLLLLIVGIGSALKSPSSSSEQTASGEKSINLSGEQDNNNTQPAAQDSSAANNRSRRMFLCRLSRLTRLRVRRG